VHHDRISYNFLEKTICSHPAQPFMESSRALLHLTVAFGASCGAWVGLGEPTVGVAWGLVYGSLFGAVVGKLMFAR
jgi:hypothetical protein